MNRTTTSFIAVMIAGATSAGPAYADPPQAGPSSKTIGADVIGVLPVGDYRDEASFATGIDGRFEYGITAALAATGRIGYLYDLGTMGGISLGILPILVGAKYKLGTTGLFVDAELGASIITESGMGTSATNAKLDYQVGAGYQIGKVEAKVGFWSPGSEQLGDGTSSTLFSIMGSVGYDFASL